MTASTAPIRLGDIAIARSGDKGANANIGVVARSPAAYQWLADTLTADRVAGYFAGLGVRSAARYELPKIHAFNFVLYDALDGGGSTSLRIDAQGKTLGQAILEMTFEAPASLVPDAQVK